MTTFSAWLHDQSHRNDPVGDLAWDAGIDEQSGCLPETSTAADLAWHLLTQHAADPDLIQTVLTADWEHRWHALGASLINTRLEGQQSPWPA